MLGHWGADQRMLDDAIGAQTAWRVGWEPSFGGLMQFRARTIANENYRRIDYERGYDVSVSYARTLARFHRGSRSPRRARHLRQRFSRLAGFVRFGDEWEVDRRRLAEGRQRPSGAELFVDAGVPPSRDPSRRRQPTNNDSMERAAPRYRRAALGLSA